MNGTKEKAHMVRDERHLPGIVCNYLTTPGMGEKLFRLIGPSEADTKRVAVQFAKSAKDVEEPECREIRVTEYAQRIRIPLSTPVLDAFVDIQWGIKTYVRIVGRKVNDGQSSEYDQWREDCGTHFMLRGLVRMVPQTALQIVDDVNRLRLLISYEPYMYERWFVVVGTPVSELSRKLLEREGIHALTLGEDFDKWFEAMQAEDHEAVLPKL
jgi:hypothetical protein